MQDELLDLVDANDMVIGTILRSNYYKLAEDTIGYIRACELFIQNEEGKLWIPTRTANKRIAPNGLDYSCGGHVSSGENYIDSMLREIKEELNLTLTPSDLQFVTKIPPIEGLPYFRYLYVYKSNDAPKYNAEDFVSAAWLTPEEIFTLLDAGTPAKSSLRETIVALQQHQND